MRACVLAFARGRRARVFTNVLCMDVSCACVRVSVQVAAVPTDQWRSTMTAVVAVQVVAVPTNRWRSTMTALVAGHHSRVHACVP